MRVPRCLTVLVAGATLTLIGPAAFADTVYNNLDSNLESMSLTGIGTTGTTTLQIQVDGKPGDHPGCNIQGGSQYITLEPVVNEAVATVTLSDGGTFNSCGDSVVATVTAVATGTTDVTFGIIDSKTDNDPALTFNLDQAAFSVTVTEGSTDVPATGCDADPAAPAWANAMLQKAGIKAKAASNYVAQIAQQMGQGATFGGYAKNASEYPTAVHDALVALTNKEIPAPSDAARPGWECGAIS